MYRGTIEPEWATGVRFRLGFSAGAGDCFFDSLAQILTDCIRKYRPENDRRPLSPMDARRLVANAVLTGSRDDAAKEWIAVARDSHAVLRDATATDGERRCAEIVARRMRFVCSCPAFSGAPFSPDDRVEIARAMLHRDLYWGDETALEIVEAALKMHIVVFSEHGVRSAVGAARLGPKAIVGFMYLPEDSRDESHFQPAKIDGAPDFIYFFEDLPAAVRRALRPG